MKTAIVGFLFICSSAVAQSVDYDADQKGFTSLRQSGQLATVEVTPAGKELRLRLIGNSAAKVKLNDLSVEATYGLGKVKKRITLTKQNDEFILKRSIDKPLDLQIRVMSTDQAEDFDFRLK